MNVELNWSESKVLNGTYRRYATIRGWDVEIRSSDEHDDLPKLRTVLITRPIQGLRDMLSPGLAKRTKLEEDGESMRSMAVVSLMVTSTLADAQEAARIAVGAVLDEFSPPLTEPAKLEWSRLGDNEFIAIDSGWLFRVYPRPQSHSTPEMPSSKYPFYAKASLLKQLPGMLAVGVSGMGWPVETSADGRDRCQMTLEHLRQG